MMFNIEWVIQNPIQTIDKGINVIFDSEPILLAATIITFCIVAFFVWNKNKVKLYKMVQDRKPMEPVKIDKDDIMELKSALGKASVSEESMRSPLRQISDKPSARGPLPPKEQTKTSGEAAKGTMAIPSIVLNADIRPSDPVKADEPPDELIDYFVSQYTDDEQEQKEMKSMENLPTTERIDDVGTDNKQHTYEEKKTKKVDGRTTPEARAKRKEALRKYWEKRKHEKTGREIPEKP